jgi:hypothetical protein
MMKKIDTIFPDIGLIPAIVLTIVFAAALQLGGSWIVMLIAGALGSLFIRRHRIAFLVGFLGVFIGWLILFSYLILTSQAIVIADFFLGLLGIHGLGGLVIIISCIIGGLLGGFGALLGRSIIEIIDEFITPEIQAEVME